MDSEPLPVDTFNRSSLATHPLPSTQLHLSQSWHQSSSGLAIVDILNQGHTFQYRICNPANRHHSPIPIQQLLGAGGLERLPDTLQQLYTQHFDQCLQSGITTSFSTDHLSFTPTGRRQITIDPLQNEQGTITQLLVTTLKIETPDSLADTSTAVHPHHETTFRQLVEQANDIISIWDLDGIITYLSPSLKYALGYDTEDLLGQSFPPLVHPDDLAQYLGINQHIVTTGKSLSGIEFRTQHKAGHWIWISVNIVPIKDSSGQVIAFHGIMRDIDTSKRQETALRFIVEGTLAKTGDDFFQTCVKHLAQICQAQYAFITELVDQKTLKMLALWTGEDYVEPYEFEISGTPCQAVFQDNWGIFQDSLQARFPNASSLATLDAESYLGIIIKDSQGNALGNLGIIDTKPLSRDLTTPKFILQLFATRIGNEMKRTKAELNLQEYANQQTLLNQIAHQIRNSLDVDAVITNALQSICLLLDIDYSAFAWQTTIADTPMLQISQEAKTEGIPSFLGSYPMSIVGPIDQYIVNQQTLRIDQTDHYPEPLHRAFLQKVKAKSELVLPIRTQANRTGLMICGNFVQQRPWTDDEVTLLEAVKTQLAIAIEQAELYANSQHTSQRLQQTLQELNQTHAQMVQSEKMSSLGQLVAGVAHEINNPVSFIHGNLTPAKQYAEDLLALIELYQTEYPNSTPNILEKIDEIDLDFLTEDLPKLLNSLQVGTERIREIVKSLRLFSRLDEAEFKSVDIHAGIDSTLMILHSHIKATAHRDEIQLIKNYASLPLVECFAGQLNQVFMNILVNAIDALDDHAQTPTRLQTQVSAPLTITIETQVIEENKIRITIKDNGPGMPDTVKQHIFNPFFTTKPVGKGTGMGLSISYQIVTEKHNGELMCRSTPDDGTEFIITLPIDQPSPSSTET